jgi:hypothetical protein
LQTNGDEPPIEEVDVVDGADDDELKDVVVIGEDCCGMLGGEDSPNMAAVVDGG